MKKTKDTVVLQQVVMPRSTGKKTKTNGHIQTELTEVVDSGVNSRTFETRFNPRYEEMPAVPDGLEQPTFSESANRILKERYLLKGGNLQAVETIAERFWHIAYDIASADFDFKSPKSEVFELAKKFYGIMVGQKFLPNSPTIMNAGKQNQLQYSACFVLPVEDSITEIFDTMKYAALIHQTGGGTGFAFSRLRPAGSMVKRSGGVASGPVSFLRVYDAATQAIKQGGTRRGANMGILRVDHPDVLEFIRCKAELDEKNKPVYDGIAPLLPDDSARTYLKTLLLDGQISNFNISVAMTREFMDAYRKAEDFNLIDPHSGEVTGSLNAKDVFEEMVDRAWHTGDPGCIFIDRINNSPANPVPDLETIESTNPCVTGDTWVHTSDGPRQVKDLVGRPFLARINGKNHLSGSQGFFETGEKEIIKLQTKEGYNLKLTSNHLVQRITKLSSDKVLSEWCEAGNLKPGDYVAINNHRQNTHWHGIHNYNEGYLIGLLVGDGTLKSDKAVLSVWDFPVKVGPSVVYKEGTQSVMQFALQSASSMPHRSDFNGWMSLPARNEHRLALGYIKSLAHKLGMYPGNKTITPEIEKTSSDFYKGFLRGFFDADGSVQFGTQGRINVRLAQSNLTCLEAVQRMLLRLGIVSQIYKNRRLAGKKSLPEGKGGYKEYPVKAQHELVISRDNLDKFDEMIGFANSDKSTFLKKLLKTHNKVGRWKEKFLTEVKSLEIEPKEQVYDVQIPEIHYFDANGIIAHNCGEQPLAAWDACNLGSINLGKFVLADGTDVDWDGLKKVTRQAVHFLDNVVQTNPFTIQEIYEEVHRNRRIGLGVMGWADMLFLLKIAYDSDEALKLAEKVMRFINDEGHRESEDLAEKRGPFPNWLQSIYSSKYNGNGKKHPSFDERPDDAYAYGNGKPLRNSTVTTIAPTGTISIIGDCSSGIEPVFALAYLHRAKGDGGKTGNEIRTLTIANKTFTEIGLREGFYDEKIAQKVMDHGSVMGVDDVPPDWQRVFVTAPEIAPDWHVKMQAAFQRYTDNGVSKTINLPNSATKDDIRNAYLMAYETGCNGITVYRDGSKAVQVLNLSSSIKPKEAEKVETVIPSTHIDRPMILRGRTYEIMTPVGKAFVTVNRDENNMPFEVFLTVGKGGMHTMADAEAIGRLTSISLRVAGSSRFEVAQKIVAQLRGIGGSSTIGFGKDRVMSLADALAKVLSEDMAHVTDEKENEVEMLPLELTDSPKALSSDDVAMKTLPLITKNQADLCPECGEATFVFEEGCKKCHSCGYSMC